eukprot:TRINITY_DN88712_c0_g1_i1.p3 TRINITY_DN88712_c0_g1~~TRINITY_DN88712_c0_g1_i1.p3  ORF type:complete len:649 (-),score=118.55 TRINITY_DN88712_c0_g1_i1:2924-4870(-)
MKEPEKKEESKKEEGKKEEEKKEEVKKEEEKKEQQNNTEAETAEDLERAEQRKDQQRLFIASARFNNPAKLEELIQAGVNINCEDENRWTALMHACVQGHEEIVRILLKKKAMLEPSGLLGPTSVEEKKDIDIDKELEEKPKQYTPLHWASHKGHLRIVWLLLNRGYSLTDEDPIGNTPVHQAAAGGSVKVLECFMSQGVDIEKKNTRGHTPLHLSTDAETRQLIQKAIKKEKCECGSKFDFTNVRFYCTKCSKFCCRNCKENMIVDETVESAERERPICLCKECLAEHKMCTKLLDEALNNTDFDRVDQILKIIEKKRPEVDVKKLDQLKRHHTSLMYELKIRTFYKSLDVVPNFKTIKKSVFQLGEMVKEALDKKVELSQAILAEVNQCTKRLLAERDLRMSMDSTSAEDVDEPKRDRLKECITKAQEAGVSEEYTSVADVVLDKMSGHIQAKQILEKFEGYPERVYPEPEVIDPKKKKPKKEEKKVVKRKKKEPPFLIPDWASDLTEVIKEVDTMNGLIKKAEEINLDKDFLSKVQTQLARFKKEIAYRKQLEAEAKAAAEAKALAKKQKKKKQLWHNNWVTILNHWINTLFIFQLLYAKSAHQQQLTNTVLANITVTAKQQFKKLLQPVQSHGIISKIQEKSYR